MKLSLFNFLSGILFLAIVAGGIFAGIYFGRINVSSKEISVSGILKSPNLLSPPRTYCEGRIYIESDKGTLLVNLNSNNNFSTDQLYTSIDQFSNISGALVKGQNCNPKNSCGCDDSINVTSISLDATKSAEYAAALPSYEGLTKCFTSDTGGCSPVLLTTTGKTFQLVDVGNNFLRNVDGDHIIVNASFSSDTILGASVAGTLYVDTVKNLQ